MSVDAAAMVIHLANKDRHPRLDRAHLLELLEALEGRGRQADEALQRVWTEGVQTNVQSRRAFSEIH